MTAIGHPLNRLPEMLDGTGFDLLRSHLATIEMVRETVLGGTGVASRHFIFSTADPFRPRFAFPKDRTIEVAMQGRDCIVGRVRRNAMSLVADTLQRAGIIQIEITGLRVR